MAVEQRTQIEIAEAQSRLEELFDLFEADPQHVVVLTRDGVPVALMEAPVPEGLEAS